MLLLGITWNNMTANHVYMGENQLVSSNPGLGCSFQNGMLSCATSGVWPVQYVLFLVSFRLLFTITTITPRGFRKPADRGLNP
jgi:hypothetical protein